MNFHSWAYFFLTFTRPSDSWKSTKYAHSWKLIVNFLKSDALYILRVIPSEWLKNMMKFNILICPRIAELYMLSKKLGVVSKHVYRLIQQMLWLTIAWKWSQFVRTSYCYRSAWGEGKGKEARGDILLSL